MSKHEYTNTCFISAPSFMVWEAKQAKDNEGPASFLPYQEPALQVLFMRLWTPLRQWGPRRWRVLCGCWNVFAVLFWEFSFCCVFPTFLLLLYHSFSIGSVNPLMVLCHLHRMESYLQGWSQDVETRNKTLTKSPRLWGFISVQDCEGYQELWTRCKETFPTS